MYLTDIGTARAMTPAGAVSTLAGIPEMQTWRGNGPLQSALPTPADIAVKPGGTLLVTGSMR